MQHQAHLEQAIRCVNTFAPKQYREVICEAMRAFARLSCDFGVGIDVANATHKITIVNFPEGSDIPLWFDVVLAFTFDVERFETRVLPKLALELRVRRSALAFARYCQKDGVQLMVLDAPGDVPGSATGEGGENNAEQQHGEVDPVITPDFPS